MATRHQTTVASILRRWDGIANQQLIAAAARLAEENDRLREQLQYAEDAAISWRNDAMRLMEDACLSGTHVPAISIDGDLVTLPVSTPIGGHA